MSGFIKKLRSRSKSGERSEGERRLTTMPPEERRSSAPSSSSNSSYKSPRYKRLFRSEQLCVLTRPILYSSRRVFVGCPLTDIKVDDNDFPDPWPNEWQSLSDLGKLTLARRRPPPTALIEVEQKEPEPKSKAARMLHALTLATITGYRLVWETCKTCTDWLAHRKPYHVRRPFAGDGLYELRPRLNLRSDRIHPTGYVTHWLDDGTAMVQIKGAGLKAWERLTMMVGRPIDTKLLAGDRWYCVDMMRTSGEVFTDRAVYLYEGIYIGAGDERSIDRPILYFPDNGYYEQVHDGIVYEIANYNDVNSIPPQAMPVHVVGVTGNVMRSRHHMLKRQVEPGQEVEFVAADRVFCESRICHKLFRYDFPHVILKDVATNEFIEIAC